MRRSLSAHMIHITLGPSCMAASEGRIHERMTDIRVKCNVDQVQIPSWGFCVVTSDPRPLRLNVWKAAWAVQSARIPRDAIAPAPRGGRRTPARYANAECVPPYPPLWPPCFSQRCCLLTPELPSLSHGLFLHLPSQNAQVTCFVEACVPAACQRPVKLKGECCAVCLGEAGGSGPGAWKQEPPRWRTWHRITWETCRGRLTHWHPSAFCYYFSLLFLLFVVLFFFWFSYPQRVSIWDLVWPLTTTQRFLSLLLI